MNILRQNFNKIVIVGGAGSIFAWYNSSKCPITNQRRLNMFGENLRESGSALLLKTIFSPSVPLAEIQPVPENNRQLLTSVMVRHFLQGKEVSQTFPVYDKLDEITNRLLENNPELFRLARPKIHVTMVRDLPAFSLADHIVISMDFINSCTDSQLAFIIGHELSHHLLDHHVEVLSWRILELLTFGVVIAMMSRGRLLASLLWILLKPFKVLVTFPFMRRGEFAADDLGLQMTMNAGYNPQEVLRMWDDLEMVRPTPALLPYITDHPSHQERRSRQVQIVETRNNSWQ